MKREMKEESLELSFILFYKVQTILSSSSQQATTCKGGGHSRGQYERK